MADLHVEQPSQAPPRLRLQQLMSGYRITQAIGVAAELGIADLLSDGPKSSGELAEATGTHPRALYRVLRALASVGIFTEVEPDRFALTPMAEALRADAPASLLNAALFASGDANWRAWGQLLHSVRTGQTAFEHVHGMDVWEYRARHPEANTVFNAAMTSYSAQVADAIAGAYDFTGLGTLVDVGGGHGLLLATILSANPALRGILFDQPHVVATAAPILERSGMADRCRVVGGDFFDSVPSG
ncbi:MAG TPA: methyltransferase, partial [Dehalococcoidia bacterium]|nr:methyltransferase [Dehalococcoidia bacterium]